MKLSLRKKAQEAMHSFYIDVRTTDLFWTEADDGERASAFMSDLREVLYELVRTYGGEPHYDSVSGNQYPDLLEFHSIERVRQANEAVKNYLRQNFQYARTRDTHAFTVEVSVGGERGFYTFWTWRGQEPTLDELPPPEHTEVDLPLDGRFTYEPLIEEE